MTIEESDTIEILRDRLKEYRELLEVCYNYLDRPNKTEAAADKIKKKLNEHGVGTRESLPLQNKDEL